MTSWTIAGVVIAGLAMLFAYLAWRDARPFEPFTVTPMSGGTFGLRRTGTTSVAVESVIIPHWMPLRLANESALEGPFQMRRGEVLYFGLPDDARPGVDILVEWRNARWWRGRRHRYWHAHLLDA